MPDRTDVLTVADYARLAPTTDRLQEDLPHPLDAPLMGLVGELGSVLTAAKKAVRSDSKLRSFQDAASEEFGDFLWYAAMLCHRAEFVLAELLSQAVGYEGQEPLTFEACDGDVAKAAADGNVEVRADALVALNEAVARISVAYIACREAEDCAPLREGLVDALRAHVRAVNQCGLSLADVAWRNREKIEARWPVGERDYPPLLDEDHPDDQERLPREPFEVRIEERTRGEKPNERTFVFQTIRGVNIGDPLTDNISEGDDYRFHDVFHYAYAAKLGWSPVLRALLKLKRKSDPAKDENEDGARAILIEEGLAAMVFNTAKREGLDFFEGMKAKDTPLPYDLLKDVAHLVTGYEAADTPLWLWEEAILDGFECFRFLATERGDRPRGGILRVDVGNRSITVHPLEAGDRKLASVST